MTTKARKAKRGLRAGDQCVLHSLEDFPQFNGRKVTIIAERVGTTGGQAFYVDGGRDLADGLEWVYATRLKLR